MKALGRVFKVVLGALAGFALLLGGQVIYALTRDFPLNDPPDGVSGEFGDPSLPLLKFVVLGDSTSVGVGTTPENSYPWILATRLGERYRVKLDVVGVGGATTADVADNQVDLALALEPDLILVEIGANDTTHMTPLRKVEEKMAQALDRLAQAESKLIVIGPPNMGTSPVMPRPLRTISGWRGAAVGRRIERVTLERGITYVDLAAGTRDEFRDDPDSYYSTDQFHPGAGGYALWADVMYPAVLAEVESPG